MKVKLPFVKLQGVGNDFIVVDARQAMPAGLDQPSCVQALCRRGHGIGADGVLLVLPPRVNGAHARMRVLNADGSEPEMCGNGIRCVAKLLYEGGTRGASGNTQALLIDTDAGLLSCRVEIDDSDRVGAVRVAMGAPRVDATVLPLDVAGRGPLVGSAVNMGNPHYVSFIDSPTVDLLALARDLGPRVETHPAFPDHTNVEFARISSTGAMEPPVCELVVWERGCGITQACGTGACATAVAAVSTGRAPAEHSLAVVLPGGRLDVEVAGDLSQVWMTGPVVEVYRAELFLPATMTFLPTTMT